MGKMWGFKETRGFMLNMRESRLNRRNMQRVKLQLQKILAKLKRESTGSAHEKSVAAAELHHLGKGFIKMKTRMDIEVKKLENQRQALIRELHLARTQNILSSKLQHQKKIE